jgi:hypothetical protein
VIDAISRRVPCLSKVAPNSHSHMEDVHPHGGRAPGRRHPRDPRRAVTRRAAQHRRAHRALPVAGGVAREVGHPRQAPVGHRRCAVSSSARRGAHHAGVLHGQPLVLA